ncbi:MAG: DUF5916 domain-containing protein [Flavobacteriaceae bacterium]
MKAKRISTSIKIDGNLDEPEWLSAEKAKDFLMLEPGTGDLEPENQKTVVKILYDDEAIYIGAYLYDDDPSSVARQFTQRDEFGQSDFFGVALNPNNDGQNESGFVVMASGTQADMKMSLGNDDSNWNAVWDSQVSFKEDGWVVEIRIPYAMLRFSNQAVQTWGINFFRSMQDTRATYTWNFIDKTKGYGSQYAGLLTGIENLKPPIRLSFYPYGSIYNASTSEGENDFSASLGLDVKYGVSEAFTLDVTLIPDFGQTKFDNVVLNLGPFEQRYEEQRAFFTEGTDLFNQANLFYSRRIGNRPIGYWDVEDNLGPNEEIVSNPNSVKMLNALKLSGRDKNGLGLGIFNAITEKTYATIENTEDGSTREELTEPFTNYNVMVIDKQFGGNSSIGLINTNVLRQGDFRDANTTALLFDLANKANTYKIEGNVKGSFVNDSGAMKNGFSGYTSIENISGKFQFKVGNFWADRDYDIVDLGFQRRVNYNNVWGEISYRIFEPTEKLNQFQTSFSSRIDHLFKPSTYTGNNFEAEIMATNKKNFSFGGSFEFQIGNQYDYNEPRTDGRFVIQNPDIETRAWISSDYNKLFALDLRLGYTDRMKEDRDEYGIVVGPRFKLSNKFLVTYNWEYFVMNNMKGYVTTTDNDQIIFGDRNFKDITNALTAIYNFNALANLSLAFRHYWAPISYGNQFYQLEDDGYLSPLDYTENENYNFNVWNMDLSYNWQFAPGSNIVALYRNSISKEDQLSDLPFMDNIDNLLKEGMNHMFSLRVIYFIDYNRFKK